MQGFFNHSAQISPVERDLKKFEIEYQRLPDGRIVVPGDIQLNMENLKELPDFTEVIVKGSFECISNHLTSLKGAPKWVGGDFLCMGNELTSLRHAPQHVGGDFECYSFDLHSLEGAPKFVGGTFNTHECPLADLEHAPATFSRMVTRLGTFTSWDDVPRHLKISEKTRERLHTEALVDDIVLDNSAARTAVRVMKPLSFTKQPSM